MEGNVIVSKGNVSLLKRREEIMSVIIEDMTMPECCMKCPMAAGYGCGYMGIIMTTKDMESGRHKDCPLVEVEDE